MTQNFNANIMQLVSSQYDYQVTRNCNFSVQNGQINLVAKKYVIAIIFTSLR